MVGNVLTLCAGEQLSRSLKEVVCGEAKSASTPLSPVRSDTTERGVTAQAAKELLCVRQLRKQEAVPKLLFGATSFYSRPFLYFKDVDILLTTKKAFEWRRQDVL